MRQNSFDRCGSGGPSGRGRARGSARLLLGVLALFALGAAEAVAQHTVVGRVTASLRFSLLGYTTQTIGIEGREVLNVTLTTEALRLGGLTVTVGYGEKSRLTLTESVGTVSSEEIAVSPIATPEVALQGRVSGVQVLSQSGNPGAPVSVRIRGVGTVGNTQPLFVIDGVPVGRGSDAFQSPLATINPSDIEEISVLKDASAAAVYGVQAANGVVLITTKRGRYGKPTIRYDGYTGIQNFPDTYDMLDTQGWLQLTQAAYDNYNEYYGYTPEQSEYVRLAPVFQDAQLMSRNTDWQDVIADENAPIQNHNLSVSGASELANYYVSAGYFGQQSIIDRWDLDRYTFRANSDFNVTDRVRFGETFSLSYQETLFGQNNGYNGQLLRNSIVLPPFFEFRDTDNSIEGNRYGFSGNPEFAQAGLTIANAPALNQITENIFRKTRVLGGLYAEAEILEGLTLKSQGNVDVGIERRTWWSPDHTAAEIGFGRESPAAREDRLDNYGLVWTNTATFERSVGPHDFSVLGGVEAQKYGNTGTQLQAFNCLTYNEDYRRVTSACWDQDTGSPPLGWAGESAFFGYLGRLTYDYADKYLLTASVRRDGSSSFAPENRWGTFPSVSAGWRISEEPFFNVPWITELKLRGSWGQLGNSDTGASYPYIFRVTTGADYGLNGETVVKAATPANFVNRDLIWETTETTDFGFETVLFDGAVDFATTYFRRDTKDFLVPIPLPDVAGFGDAPAFGTSPLNSGLVRNTGFEFEAGWTPPQLVQDLGLNLQGNLTTVNTELKALTEGLDVYTPASGGFYRTEVGQPIGQFYGYKTCGIYQTAEAAAAAPEDGSTSEPPQPGDYCFVDVNGDGQITTDDRTFIGKSNPDFFFGLNVNATWRAFDLGLFFNGMGGVQGYNKVRRDIEVTNGGGANRSAATLDYWTPENTDTTIPRAFNGDPNDNNRFSDRWIEDRGYFRLRSLQLGYTFQNGWLGIPPSTRIYLAGSNLFTITDYSGLDPEFTTSIDFDSYVSQSATENGTDYGNTPQPRIFQIGVSTSF
jgi:TonB-linked SusC/RagA family outer membrane protein